MHFFSCSCDNTVIVLRFKIPLILTVYGHVGENLISFISCNFTPFYREKKSKVLKGLAHGFCLNSKLFYLCAFLLRNQVSKSLFDILDRNECFLDQKIDLWRSDKKSKFAKGFTSMVFVQKANFFVSVFFRQIKWKKNRFCNILDRKECFFTRKVNFEKVLKIRRL